MSYSQYFFSIFITTLASIDIVNSGVAELELFIDPVSFENVNLGDTGEFSVTVMNNGPDAAGADSVFPYPVSVATEILFANSLGGLDAFFSQNTKISQDCVFLQSIQEPRPGDPAGFFYTFYFPVIPPNSSLTCYGRFTVGFSSGARTIDWNVFNPTDTDPNINNNLIGMRFGITPAAVPSSSIWLILSLCLGILIVLKIRNNLH